MSDGYDFDKEPGEVNCLGWCNKKFQSPDRFRIRYCPRCRSRKTASTAGASRIELLNSGKTVDTKIHDACRD